MNAAFAEVRLTPFSGHIVLSCAICKKHFDRIIDPLPLRSLLLAIVAIAV